MISFHQSLALAHKHTIALLCRITSASSEIRDHVSCPSPKLSKPKSPVTTSNLPLSTHSWSQTPLSVEPSLKRDNPVCTSDALTRHITFFTLSLRQSKSLRMNAPKKPVAPVRNTTSWRVP